MAALVFSATSSSSSIGVAGAVEPVVCSDTGSFGIDGMRNLDKVLESGIAQLGCGDFEAILCALPPCNSLNRLQIAQMLFDRFERVLLVPRGALALSSYNLSSGLFIDHWDDDVVCFQLFDDGYSREPYALFRSHNTIVSPYTKEVEAYDGWEDVFTRLHMQNHLPIVVNNGPCHEYIGYKVFGGENEDNVWIGGSILASLLGDDAFVKKSEFEDFGEIALDRK